MFKKKRYVSIFVVISTVSVLIVSIIFNQWHNIKAVYEAFNTSENELIAKKDNTQDEINKVLESYEISQLPMLTNQELQQLLSGELSVEKLTDKITQEQILYDPNEATQNITSQSSQSTVPTTYKEPQKFSTTPNTTDTQANQPSNVTTEVDTLVKEREIVAYYTTQMYILQAKYVGLLDVLKNRGVELLVNTPSEARTLTHLTNKGMPILQEASRLEKECDQAVAQLLSDLSDELKILGKDTSIIHTMEEAYESEKVLQKAYYISLAKSML